MKNIVAREVEEHLAAIHVHLDRLLPIKERDGQVSSAARYAMLGGGKRLRPLLCTLVASALGSSLEKSLTPACALEFVHTYSLVHDDLPAMDDDDFRRGRAAVHKKFGEAVAILVGDHLLTFAFALCAKSPDLTAEQRISLVQQLSLSAGLEGMIGGQGLDLQMEEITEAGIAELHTRKTAALFAASMAFGAIVAAVPKETVQAFYECGESFGLAFQTLDDLSDVAEDVESHRPNSLHVWGEEGTRERATFLLRQTQKLIEGLPGKVAPLLDLVSRMQGA